MKTNELMYKNYVEHNGLIRQISGFRTYSTNHTLVRFEMSAGEYMVESLNPIPLSKEWLLKAGFVKHSPYFSNGSIIEFYENNNALFCELPNDNVFYHIKYVHQLQNLYFALTGVELVFSTEP